MLASIFVLENKAPQGENSTGPTDIVDNLMPKMQLVVMRLLQFELMLCHENYT